ncbi:MAG: ATP-binding protein [Thermoproteus sp.]
MFVDREEELSFLQRLYESGRPQLVLLYGRRRVGKTWLVKRFLEGRRGLYFYAQRRPLADELARLAEALSAALGRYVKPQWDSIFAALRDAGRFVLVVDEFGYWLDEDPGVLSALQSGWDEYLGDSQVFLILLTSTHAVAERAVSYGGGLFGRKTAQIRLGPLAPPYTRHFLPKYDAPELAAAYAVSNGIPHYLALFDRDRELGENIAFLFSRWGPLYEEAENLLRHEVREPYVYFNIVRTIEEGATTYSEIADRAHISAQTLAKYLHVLEKLEVIRREVPVLGKARPIYVVSDLYMKFWIRFVYPQREWIELGNPPRLDLDGYMAAAYEEIIRRALPHLHKTGLIKRLGRCGRYWQKDVEVDIVCVEDGHITAVEVKWSDLGRDDVEEIIEDLRRKLGGREGDYYVAARRGPRDPRVLTAEDVFGKNYMPTTRRQTAV